MLRKIESVDEIGPDSIIYKHSTTCGSGAKAKVELERLDREVLYLIVQEQRSLSDEIAAGLSLKHESPQLIILKHGRIAAVLNHWHITKELVEGVLDLQHHHY